LATNAVLAERMIIENENKKILLVDDESEITRLLRHSLESLRVDVRACIDGESAIKLFHEWSPDLVITDLVLPSSGGIELCREIRKNSQVPIIVLAVNGEEKIKVEALDAGADDFITKPFGIDELLARVRAALRRAPSSHIENFYRVGDFFVNLETQQVFVRNAEVRLTPKEFELLLYLIKNREKVLTHQSLLQAIWGENSVEQPEYLRVFLGNLRKKIEPNPSKPQYILTKPWVGYRFQPNGAEN
jgi:two-component system KDP operon response regulator KdpE